MSSQPQPSAPVDEDRLFRRVKIGVFLMLVVFAIEIFTFLPQYWPITRWRMYSGAREMSPVAETLLVRVTTGSGETVDLFPSELGFVAGEIIEGAYAESAARDIYRALLVERVRAALPDTDIESLAGWRNRYNVAYTSLPPIDLDAPDDTELLGVIEVNGGGS